MSCCRDHGNRNKDHVTVPCQQMLLDPPGCLVGCSSERLKDRYLRNESTVMGRGPGRRPGVVGPAKGSPPSPQFSALPVMGVISNMVGAHSPCSNSDKSWMAHVTPLRGISLEQEGGKKRGSQVPGPTVSDGNRTGFNRKQWRGCGLSYTVVSV